MLRVIRYHKANGYDHSKVPLLKRGDRIQLEDGSHHIYGGSHPPGWLRDDPELDPAPESSGGGSTPKSEPTEEAEPGPPREAAPRGRALEPPKSDVQQRLAERRSKRDYSPDLVTPLDDLHAQEIDSFFAGDPAADSLDVILMRAEVRTESHLNVGREQKEPLVKEEQEEEAEVVKDEEVSVEMEAGTADEADDVALPANRAYVEGRFYPYGSWRCFFCEAINPVTEDQCLTTHAGGPNAGAPCDGRWINGIDIGWWEVDPQTAPEQWRRRFSAEELEEQQARADAARLLREETGGGREWATAGFCRSSGDTEDQSQVLQAVPVASKGGHGGALISWEADKTGKMWAEKVNSYLPPHHPTPHAHTRGQRKEKKIE